MKKETNMTNSTYDLDAVSDLHKDAYGFRPSASFYFEWDNSSETEKQATWDRLIEALNYEIENEKRREAAAIEAFEARVADTIRLGASDRATAIRWLAGAVIADSDYWYDLDDVAWVYGLPHGYLVDHRDAQPRA